MDRFTYQLTIRPAGVDTTPAGVGREIHDTDLLAIGRNYGSVSYAQALTTEEIAHYALLPVTQMRAVNGCEFTQEFLGVRITHRVSLTPDLRGLQVETTTSAGRTYAPCLLNWAEFVTRSKTWKPTPSFLPIDKPAAK